MRGSVDGEIVTARSSAISQGFLPLNLRRKARRLLAMLPPGTVKGKVV